jgi:class 3 adenylate cyclase
LQTATTEILDIIIRAPGNVHPVFDTILEKALRLCDASYCILWSFDGSCFRPSASRLPERIRELLVGFAVPTRVSETHARLLRGEPLVHTADISADELDGSGDDPLRYALTAEARARTLLMVPLNKGDELVGALSLYRTSVRLFANRQINFVQHLAAQTVIAIENARLLGELRERTEEIAELNRGLEARIAEQVEELSRVGRLKRFLAPQLAELIVSQGHEKILQSHRREIVVVFCDLRGYTAFTETAEPEEVLDFLREYHGALGPLVSQFEGTLDQFSGDGIMVFFNDPVPIPDPAERAVKMAVAMREAASPLIAALRERGRELGFGAGIAQGYATLGHIGFSERSGYTAIGTVCNVAARLCGEAKDGQILLSQRVNVALKGSVATEQVGALALKGLTQPVVAYNVPLTASQPALRVIDGGNR